MFSTTKSFSRLSFNKINFKYIAKCSSKLIHNAASQQSTVQNIGTQTFGQPLHQSHPHLIEEGEIMPGVKTEEFKHRRHKLLEKVAHYGSTAYSQAIIIPSASKVYMSDKIPYVFRQNSDFMYLTGCQEPDSILLLTIKGDSYSSILFMRQKDAHAELWDGPRTGIDASLSIFDVDQVLPVGEFGQFLVSFLSENKKSTVWYDTEDVVQSEIHAKLNQIIKLSDRSSFSCPKRLIHEIRVIKSPAEINLMKRSCEIASAAISKTIEKAKPGMSEHELFATVDYESRMRGAEFLAYPPVVAGGKNANIIHYIANNQIINDKEMVLMDAGCEYHCYSSDITRTWPISGTFTPEQRILYEIVFEVQKTLIDKLREMPSLDKVYHEMCSLLGKRLQEAGLIPKNLSGNKLVTAAYTYCPHHVSHYLGMDVHDTPKVSRSIQVQPGMVVTVEPGIYVNPKNQFAPPEFHNLGIRIEDDVLIEESGPVVLTECCPKEISEIERLASQNQK